MSNAPRPQLQRFNERIEQELRRTTENWHLNQDQLYDLLMREVWGMHPCTNGDAEYAAVRIAAIAFISSRKRALEGNDAVETTTEEITE